MLARLSTRIGILFLCAAALLTAGCGGGSKAKLRVLNAVPNQSQITVLLDGNATFNNVAYGIANDYMSTGDGSRHIQVEPAGSTNFIIDQNINLNSGTNTTFIAADFSSTSSGIVLTDDTTAPTSGNVKIRIVNGSPNLGAVDVFIVPPGTSLNSVSPTITNLGFGSSSDYQSLVAGSYEIFFTPHGSTFAFLDTGAVSFAAEQNRTVVVLNNLSGGFQVTTLTDLN
jgi:hypothetical protein